MKRKPYNREKYTMPAELELDVDDLFIQRGASGSRDRTITERLPQWIENFKVNRDTIGFKVSVADLPKIRGSVLVVDKSFASTKFYEQVHHLKDYNGTLIVCDRALAYVLKHRVPEYVCQLDSSYLCQYFLDLPEVKKHMHEMTCIFASTTHPLTVRLWNGPRVWFQPYMGSWSLTNAMMGESGLPYMPTGGEVSTFGWLLALNIGAKNIGLFGITNSYDDLNETEYPGVKHKKIEGPYGTCWADPVYEFYAKTHLAYIKLAKEKLGIRTINTMKAGVMYSDYVEDMSLEEFVREFK